MSLQKSFDTPDETRKTPYAKIDTVNFLGHIFTRYTFEPGWRWSRHVKPAAGTELCQVLHVGYQVSGRSHVVFEDGTEMEIGPGDVAVIPPGHDGWTVGNEPAVFISFS